MAYRTLTVPGTRALRRLDELRDAFGRTGEYPFLTGPRTGREDPVPSARDAADERPAGPSLSSPEDPAGWLATRAEAFGKRHGDPDRLLGPWPRAAPPPWTPRLHRELLTGRHLPRVEIGLARIEAPWELPLVLQFGGWGDCPTPAQHCAVHRAWYERFGAEITGMTEEVVECRVSRRPGNRGAALDLARAQYGYCPAIVERGIGSLSELAAMLLESEYWYFYWE